MYIIGERIHIISESVKEALKQRDVKFFQESAVRQLEAGAQALQALETALQGNAKIIVPSDKDLVNVIGDMAGIVPLKKST